MDHFELFDTKKNNLVPVDRMKDGTLGVPLNSLGLVIQRLYHQLYRLKNLESKATQTLKNDDWIEMMRRQIEDRPVMKLKLGPVRQSPKIKRADDSVNSRASHHSKPKHKTRVRHFAGSVLNRTVPEYTPSDDARHKMLSTDRSVS